MKNKIIFEGWTIQDFINDLEPLFNQIQSNKSWQKPFTTKEEIKKFCINNQPYYKKHIPEVYEYFKDKIIN